MNQEWKVVCVCDRRGHTLTSLREKDEMKRHQVFFHQVISLLSLPLIFQFGCIIHLQYIIIIHKNNTHRFILSQERYKNTCLFNILTNYDHPIPFLLQSMSSLTAVGVPNALS